MRHIQNWQMMGKQCILGKSTFAAKGVSAEVPDIRHKCTFKFPFWFSRSVRWTPCISAGQLDDLDASAMLSRGTADGGWCWQRRRLVWRPVSWSSACLLLACFLFVGLFGWLAGYVVVWLCVFAFSSVRRSSLSVRPAGAYLGFYDLAERLLGWWAVTPGGGGGGVGGGGGCGGCGGRGRGRFGW